MALRYTELQGPGLSNLDCDRVLKVVEMSINTRQDEAAMSALSQLDGHLTVLNDAQISRYITLAERAVRPEFVVKAIQSLEKRYPISPALSIVVLKRAQMAEDASLADAVDVFLEGKTAPALLGHYQFKAALLRQGPDAALDKARQGYRGPATPIQASDVADALIASGRARLAVRYLRRCHRRWPGATGFHKQLLTAFLRSGQAKAAKQWLDGLTQRAEGRNLEDLELSYALALGDTILARDILKRQISAGRRPKGDLTLLRVELTLGALEEAVVTESAFRHDHAIMQKASAHFGTRHLGALLNELKLFSQLQSRRPDSVGQRHIVANYLFAAKSVLDEWELRQTPQVRTASTIPRQIFQYWNEPSVPESIQQIMQSWQDIPSWRYRRMNRRQAISWLQERFGARYVRAFKAANHVAEESDFLRLCILLAEGGLYADADDKLVGSPDALVSHGAGLILFRQPTLGAVMNNIICAPRGHPVLQNAVDLALDALLRREKEIVWSKTGPGLLTRAAAMYVAAMPDNADLTLVPSVKVYRDVYVHVHLPYKNTGNHWNSRTSPSRQALRDALQDICASQQGATREELESKLTVQGRSNHDRIND